MGQETDRQEPSDNETLDSIISLGKSITGKDQLADEKIEAMRKDYWKCPKCSEVNYKNEGVCWQCEASRPKKIEHPGFEELKTDLQKENKSGLFWTGVASIIFAGAVLLRGYIYDHHDDSFPRLYTSLFAAFFVLLGVACIISWMIRKVPGK